MKISILHGDAEYVVDHDPEVEGEITIAGMRVTDDLRDSVKEHLYTEANEIAREIEREPHGERSNRNKAARALHDIAFDVASGKLSPSYHRIDNMAVATGAIERMIRMFPGLKDGETPVDGSDLVEFLTKALVGITL